MVHLIAEAGSNHNGHFKQALQLVDIAKSSGADSVKFQIINPDHLYLPCFFDNSAYKTNEAYNLRLKSILKDEEYQAIADYCKRLEIGFSASIFDEAGIKLVDRLDVPYIKIASCDLNNINLIIQAAETKRKLIISTGMATLSEIENSLNRLFKGGYENIVLMHCVSIYPANLEQTNLSFIKTLKTAFGYPVGFSDHTMNSIASAIAVAYGAEWIEKHFTYDRSVNGFDHAHSSDPEGFAHFIKEVRMAEIACKRSIIKVSQDESDVKKRARRGLYAARDLRVGEVINNDDVLVVRPESCLQPHHLSLIVGKVAKKEIHKFEAFELGMLDNE